MENEIENLEDYSLKEVPLKKRKSWIDVSMVGMGLGSIQRVILAYILGEVILIGIMTLTGYIGAKLGFSTPLIAKVSFGEKGFLIMSLCLALSFMG